MTEQEFIDKYVSDELSYADYWKYFINYEEIKQRITGMKILYNISEIQKPSWLSLDLLPKIIEELGREIECRKETIREYSY